MGGFSSDDETWEHDNKFSCRILEYGRRSWSHFGPISPSIWLVQLIAVYLSIYRDSKSSKFNDRNKFFLSMFKTLDFSLFIQSLFISYQLEMLSIQECNLHSSSCVDKRVNVLRITSSLSREFTQCWRILLTHLLLDKMTAISHTTFSNCVSASMS